MTAPTLIMMEGFENNGFVTPHTSLSGQLWYSVSGTPEWQAGRHSGKSIHLEGDSLYFRQPSGVGVFCGAVWFRRPAGAPTTDRTVFLSFNTTTTTVGQFRQRNAANGSYIEAAMTSGSSVQGPAVTDTNWHLLEFRLRTNVDPRTLDWKIDGSAQGQATRTAGAQSILQEVGFAGASDAQMDFDDFILSATLADYDSGNWGSDYVVVGKNPDGEGTDVTGTNSVVGDYTRVDDWIGGGAYSDAAAITYTSITLGDAASNYAELTLENMGASDTIWAVVGQTAVDAYNGNITVRVVDASGTTVDDIFTGANPTSGVRGFRKLITPPAGGWQTDFDGCKVRIGFSTDTNPLPYCYVVGLQYATPYTAPEGGGGDTSFAGTIPI